MGKIKIGTIKITRKVTVTQQISHRQSVQQQVRVAPTFTSAPITQNSNSAYQAIDSLNNSLPQIKSAISKATRPIKLPIGIYSPQVATLYEEINKHSIPTIDEQSKLYDVFISHASEDKESFVVPLVESLQNSDIRVWYDSIEMQWGKSLREQIDNGIKRSKYAIIVLSKNFFAKQWPKRELDGILAKEEIDGSSPLPIWYNISKEEVYNFSPTLSGLYSLSTDKYSIEDICHSFKLILEKEKIKST